MVNSFVAICGVYGVIEMMFSSIRNVVVNPVVILKIIEVNSKRGSWKLNDADVSSSVLGVAIKKQDHVRCVWGVPSSPMMMVKVDGV